MTTLEGEHSLEIAAPIERCFEIAADIARAPRWQGTMQSARIRERDADGRPALVETDIDASVATVTVCLRFDYDEPHGLRWSRESGDLRGLEGAWSFECLDAERTRATYELQIALGRKLGLVAKGVRGPARDKVRRLLAHRPVEGLKQRAESAAGDP